MSLTNRPSVVSSILFLFWWLFHLLFLFFFSPLLCGVAFFYFIFLRWLLCHPLLWVVLFLLFCCFLLLFLFFFCGFFSTCVLFYFIFCWCRAPPFSGREGKIRDKTRKEHNPHKGETNLYIRYRGGKRRVEHHRKSAVGISPHLLF